MWHFMGKEVRVITKGDPNYGKNGIAIHEFAGCQGDLAHVRFEDGSTEYYYFEELWLYQPRRIMRFSFWRLGVSRYDHSFCCYDDQMWRPFGPWLLHAFVREVFGIHLLWRSR